MIDKAGVPVHVNYRAVVLSHFKVHGFDATNFCDFFRML